MVSPDPRYCQRICGHEWDLHGRRHQCVRPEQAHETHRCHCGATLANAEVSLSLFDVT